MNYAAVKEKRLMKAAAADNTGTTSIQAALWTNVDPETANPPSKDADKMWLD